MLEVFVPSEGSLSVSGRSNNGIVPEPARDSKIPSSWGTRPPPWDVNISRPPGLGPVVGLTLSGTIFVERSNKWSWR